LHPYPFVSFASFCSMLFFPFVIWQSITWARPTRRAEADLDPQLRLASHTPSFPLLPSVLILFVCFC
jgi:hypothetical protein